MIWNDELLFVHPQKTAGMSVSALLLRTLRGRVFLSVPAGHAPRDLPEGVTVVPGRRHEQLGQARCLLARHGRRLEALRAILVAMRNPYDMEVSRYYHLRKPEAVERSRDRRLALALPFDEFERESLFRLPDPLGGGPDERHEIASYYTLDGAMPANLRIIRFEALATDLAASLGAFGYEPGRLERRNVSEERETRSYRAHIAVPDVEAMIYRRYAWVFDNGFYERMRFDAPRA